MDSLLKLSLFVCSVFVYETFAQDPCDSIFAAVEGDEEHNKLWKAVDDACVIASCSRPDRRTISALSDALHNSLAVAEKGIERVRVANDLIEAFLEQNVVNIELCNALNDGFIYEFNATIQKFLECAKGYLTTTTNPSPETTTDQSEEPITTTDKCQNTPPLLEDRGEIDTSDLFTALEKACDGQACTQRARNALGLLAYDVSDLVFAAYSIPNTHEKLLTIISAINAFLEIFDASTVLHNVILNTQIAQWGNVSELLGCRQYAECQIGIAKSLVEMDSEGWCPLLEAINYCNECNRLEKRITWTLTNNIVSVFSKVVMEDRKFIAAERIIAFKDLGVHNSTIEALSTKIYGTDIAEWKTVRDFLVCVLPNVA